jgi:hypothetical protein
MKTYNATQLFDKNGALVTDDIKKLGHMIVATEAQTIATDHESKLMRIEIGAAIRAIAAIRNTTLTEVIVEMELCKTTHRAEKTFLKYARIAGSVNLMEMAKNPQISLSVLDEIASSKKPVIKQEQADFMHAIREGVEEICKANLVDEGFDPDAPEGKQIVLGITRNQAVGVIRRTQIEMGVETRAGGGSPERPGKTEIQSKLLQLTNLLRLMFLPADRRDAWLEKHGLLLADVGASMVALQNDLVEATIIKPEADELSPTSITGLKKLAAEQPV